MSVGVIFCSLLRSPMNMHLPRNAVLVPCPSVSFTERIFAQFHEREPPFESSFHNASTSSLVSQATKNDTAGVNLKNGPAFRNMNPCPRSSMLRISTVPEGVLRSVAVFLIAEFLKMDV